MAAQDAIDELAAKDGQTNSVSPSSLANDTLQVIFNELRERFIAVSSDSIAISTNVNAMTTITGLSLLGQQNGFVAEPTTGAVLNNSHDIELPIGSVSFQPNRSGGGAASQLLFCSEKSTDNINWVKNLDSLRKVEIPNDGETFKTNISFTETWSQGEYLRFKFVTGGGGVITFEPSVTVLEGDSVTGYSFIWSLS